jgi:uncharacterized RDD family membrane protein YckC
VSHAEAARHVAARVHGDTAAAPPEVQYEGVVTRGIALAVDAAAINVIAIAVAGAVSLVVSVLSVPDWLGTTLLALGGAVYLAWTVGYFVVFWSTTGQTPGSRLMRIRVCRAHDGDTLGPARALLRVIFLTLAAIPLLAGFVPILFDARRRGAHDMLAGTVVVSVPEPPVSGPGA